MSVWNHLHATWSLSLTIRSLFELGTLFRWIGVLTKPFYNSIGWPFYHTHITSHHICHLSHRCIQLKPKRAHVTLNHWPMAWVESLNHMKWTTRYIIMWGISSIDDASSNGSNSIDSNSNSENKKPIAHV